MKPCKGEVHNWSAIRHPLFKEGLGYCILGEPHNHPSFHNWIRTSEVIKHNKETGEIETLNSLYKLIGEENEFKST